MDGLTDFFSDRQFCGSIGMSYMKEPLSDDPCSTTPVTALHVFCTRPFLARHPEGTLSMADYALKTMELSALAWRRYNGPIWLVTDHAGKAYLKDKGLLAVYDQVHCILDDCYGEVDPIRYWAGAKIFALAKTPCPCVILDLDLIVWKPLSLQESPLTVAHAEYLSPEIADVYPPLSCFQMSSRYSFPAEWRATADPLNTAFFYINHEPLRNYYTGQAVRFMEFERYTPDDGTRCMVFAEQRILGMCADAMGIKPSVLADYDDLLHPYVPFTHVWCGKSLLNTDQTIRQVYLDCCREKINTLHSELRL